MLNMSMTLRIQKRKGGPCKESEHVKVMPGQRQGDTSVLEDVEAMEGLGGKRKVGSGHSKEIIMQVGDQVRAKSGLGKGGSGRLVVGS